MKKEKKKKHPILFFIIIFFLLIFCIYLYARYIGTAGLIVKEVAIINEYMDSDYNGFKIAHFSDIYYGNTTNAKDLSKIVEEINKLNADLVIFTGDLFNNNAINNDDKELMIKNLKNIEASLFKFAVIGDSDEENLKIYKNILEESGFILLDNTNKLIFKNSNIPINVVGLTTTRNLYDLYSNDYFTITLMHKPDLIRNIDSTNLAFAGHSLGGQIKLPFFDGIIKTDGAETYLNDYYHINKTDLYISSGIGTEKINLRLFNRPSINFYRLYNN